MLKPASLFSDGAVLCRDKEIRIFGEADDGTVKVRLKDRRGTLLADAVCESVDGWFLAVLQPQPAQTGCMLCIEKGEERAEAGDLSIGDVFLAGGQSNMELALVNADEGPELIRNHADAQLRFFNIPQIAIAGKKQQEAVAGTRWHAVAPGEGGENSAVAYFFARKLRERMPEIPVGIIGCYWGGTSITCWLEEEALRSDPEGSRYLDEYAAMSAGKTMEAWLQEDKIFWDTINTWNEAVAAYQKSHPDAPWKEVESVCGPAPWNPPAGPGSPFRPGGLAVTMVREAAPAALTGILYYQGENDAGITEKYDELMALLIRSWRREFRDEALPFLFVQLPMWLNWDAVDCRSWAKIRLAQAKARDRVENTGMICLLDQGEYGNIHPTCKRPVGERLAELAGKMIYCGGEVSPRALEMHRDGKTLEVTLSSPVTTRNGKTPALLEIAGEDGVYVPAEAEIRENKLRLSADGVDLPVHARYAWVDWSDQVNLYGKNGLPAEPFSL